jgi:hypothetical protein
VQRVHAAADDVPGLARYHLAVPAHSAAVAMCT